MIPKIIHYCWFGGKELPESVQFCIDSWKKYCPEYQIKRWDEDNFDFTICEYVKQAYEEKKWAFVSDYVRLYALVNEGGIYLDTDVEIIQPLDDFLSDKAFLGIESQKYISTAIMACEKNCDVFEKILCSYNFRSFIKKNGDIDLTTNVSFITNFFKTIGFEERNVLQNIEDVTIYPEEYFAPKDYISGELRITKNTVVIHHYASSWVNKYYKKMNEIIQKYSNDGKITLRAKILSLPYRVIGSVQTKGIKKTIKLFLKS